MGASVEVRGCISILLKGFCLCVEISYSICPACVFIGGIIMPICVGLRIRCWYVVHVNLGHMTMKWELTHVLQGWLTRYH